MILITINGELTNTASRLQLANQSWYSKSIPQSVIGQRQRNKGEKNQKISIAPLTSVGSVCLSEYNQRVYVGLLKIVGGGWNKNLRGRTAAV